MDLGFGMCRLQVQVPEHGSIQSSEQLVGKNVVTSFTNLTGNYFRSLESKSSAAQTNGDAGSKLKTTIKYVGGSVEAACALGVADGIVDLVGKSSLCSKFLSNTTQFVCLWSAKLLCSTREW